ncbi:hypothetical protein MRB53_021216 [Persea americana]|uniref:Uncharacterized protein n=1 Tax=Persea americana TaxID=3435 RepID=A0ACC2L394_PERAE|nr:hypothetical protein MRB53_021216 [Persea americana]
MRTRARHLMLWHWRERSKFLRGWVVVRIVFLENVTHRDVLNMVKSSGSDDGFRHYFPSPVTHAENRRGTGSKVGLTCKQRRDRLLPSLVLVRQQDQNHDSPSPLTVFFDHNVVSSENLEPSSLLLPQAHTCGLPCLSDEESKIWLIFWLFATCVSFLFGDGAAATTRETGGIFLLRRRAQKTD